MTGLDITAQIFEIVIIPILAVATVYLITLIHAKKQELLETTKSETTKKYIEMLDNTITDCVLATNQTYVNALKAQGSFDIEAQKKAFQLTYKAVMDILTVEAQEYLNEAINDLDKYITNKIESQVGIAKKQTA